MGHSFILVWYVMAFVIGVVSIIACAVVSGLPVVLSRDGAKHWTLHARALHPARVAPAICTFLITFILMIASVMAWTYSDAPYAPIPKVMIFAALVGEGGAMLVALLASWMLLPWNISPAQWLAGLATRVAVNFPGALILTVVFAISSIIPPASSLIALVLLAGAVAVASASFGLHLHVLHRLGLARRALPRAEQLATWAGERVGIAPRAIFEIKSPRVIVHAYAGSRYVAISSAAAEQLDDAELLALITRDLSSIKKSKARIGFVLVDALTNVAMITLVLFTLRSGRPMPTWVLGLSLTSILLVRGFARRANRDADKSEALMDQVAAMRAVERVHELNRMPVVSPRLLSAIPHLYDRLVAAGISPNYVRPKPPSFLVILAAVLAGLLTCVATSLLFLATLSIVRNAAM